MTYDGAGVALPAITGALLHRAWLKSGRPDPLVDSDAWDGFALTLQALAQAEGLTGPLARDRAMYRAGVDAARRALAAAEMHKATCPEPYQPCDCGIDDVIDLALRVPLLAESANE